MGPVTIGCPACGERLPVPCKAIMENVQDRTVLVRMDYTQARAHFQECARKAQAGSNLPQPAHQERPVPPFIAKGTRACVMCGTPAHQCMDQLHRERTGCCPSCTVGDTHPVPKGTMSCAEWGAQHGAPHDAQH